MARLGALDKFLGLREFVAELHLAGLSHAGVRDAVAESEYPVDPGKSTIEFWLRDDGVRRHLHELALDRIAFVSRKIDAAIADRLDHGADMMTTDELLAIRASFMPEVEALGTDTPTRGQITAELYGRLTDNPDLAELLRRATEDAEAGY